VHVFCEIPDGGKVPVEVDADGVGVARRGGGRVAVLAPAEVGGLVVGDAVGVDEREDYDSLSESGMDGRGRVGAAAVVQGGVEAGCVEEVRGEVEKVVGAAALAGVDGGLQEDGIGVVVVGGEVGGWTGAAEFEAEDGAVFVGLVGGFEVGEVEFSAQALDGGFDLSGVVDGGEGAGGVGAETEGGQGAVIEAVAGADGDAVAGGGLPAVERLGTVDDMAVVSFDFEQAC